MADIYMHSKLAEEVINKIDYDFNEKIVFLGAQGPDPLYYNHFSKEYNEYRKYADKMHDTTTDKLFLNMIEYVKNNLSKHTFSFLSGFICHYALDVKIHPYIYHKVGVYKKEDPDTHQYRGLHLKFERSIDALLIEKDLKIKHHKFKLIKKHFPLNQPPSSAMKIMEYTLKETYNKENGGKMYYKSIEEMYKTLKYITTDPFGIKKQLYKIIDLFNKKKDMFYKDLSFYNHLENYDFHNLEKNTWNHPITNEEYNYSVIELYDQAVIFAIKLITEVSLYLFEGKTIDLKKFFTNLSFNSGMPCDHKEPMKYFNNYRK